MDVGVTFGTCPAVAGKIDVPYVKVYCMGTGCAKFGMPCDETSECGDNLSCMSIKKNDNSDVLGVTDLFNFIKDLKMFYDAGDSTPGCYPVQKILAALMTHVKNNLFMEAGSYTLENTATLRLCAPSAWTKLDNWTDSLAKCSKPLNGAATCTNL